MANDSTKASAWLTSQETRKQLRISSCELMHLLLNSIEEAERWVLSWGTHATVIRPQALAHRLRDTGHALHSRYQ